MQLGGLISTWIPEKDSRPLFHPNNDGNVNVLDLIDLLLAFGTAGP